MIAVVIGYLTFNFLAGFFMWRYAMVSIGPSRGFLVVIGRIKTETEIKIPQGIFVGEPEEIAEWLEKNYSQEFPPYEGWKVKAFYFHENVYLRALEEFNNQLC